MTELEQAIDRTLGAWVVQHRGLWSASPLLGRPDSREELQARVNRLRARLDDAWRERQEEERVHD